MEKKYTLLTIVFIAMLFPFSLQSQELYRLNYFEVNGEKSFGFVSLSDNYKLSNHKDSIAIPDLQKRKAPDFHHLKLEDKYRERFLANTKIGENDILFAYDYAKNIVVSFPIKKLEVVACLSPYVTDDEFPFLEDDYMIGFKIDISELKGFSEYFSNNLVYVGKTNPFFKRELKPIIWKKITSKEFPSKQIAGADLKSLGKFSLGDSYKFENNGLVYYLRDLKNSAEIFARQLIVLNSSKKIVCERFYTISEGSSLVPLAFDANQADQPKQWTGKLLKDKPEVIFGFTYESFGCEGITFLKQDIPDLIINCDNRH